MDCLYDNMYVCISVAYGMFQVLLCCSFFTFLVWLWNWLPRFYIFEYDVFFCCYKTNSVAQINIVCVSYFAEAVGPVSSGVCSDEAVGSASSADRSARAPKALRYDSVISA